MKKLLTILFLLSVLFSSAQYPRHTFRVNPVSVGGAPIYATLNPSDKFLWALSNGNLTGTKEVNFPSLVRSNIGFTTGKHTVEITGATITDVASIGLANSTTTLVQIGGQAAGSYAYWSSGDFLGSGAPSAGASWTAGDVLTIAFDGDAHTLKFYKSGTLQGTFTGLPTEEFFFFIGGQDNLPLSVITVNTGQTAFTHSIAGYPDGWFN